jgi:DNA-binding GntR family transcriptional regulator
MMRVICQQEQKMMQTISYPTPPSDTATLQEQAYHLVKSRILNRELKPGQYINDTQIAEELSISRTPVREAFQLLEHEGLLISEARRGWRVYTLSLEDINEIFDIKVALEGMMVRRAAECRDETKRAALKDAMERMARGAEINDYQAWWQADLDLHHAIADMCGNERATRVIRNFNEQWQRIRLGFVAMEGRMERAIPEHRAFVESILAGNADEAEQQMRSHLSSLRDELVRVLTNMVLPFTQNGV